MPAGAKTGAAALRFTPLPLLQGSEFTNPEALPPWPRSSNTRPDGRNDLSPQLVPSWRLKPGSPLPFAMTPTDPNAPSIQPDKSNWLQRRLRSWFFGIPKDLSDESIEQAIKQLKASNALNKIVESFEKNDVAQAKSVIRNQKTEVEKNVEKANEEIKEEVKEIRERYEDLRSKMVVAIALIVAIPSALFLFLDFDFGSIMSIQTLIRQVGRLEERVDKLYKPAGEGQPPTGPGVCSEEDFFFC